MPKNNSATFVANSTYGTIEITQLEDNTTTQVDTFTLLQLLEYNDNNVTSKYCHKCNMNISYNSKNFHLYSYPPDINTYLTRGFDRELKQYILDELKDVEITSDISLISKAILHANDMTSTYTQPIASKGTIVDLNVERYLSSLTSDDLLFLYKKRIILEAQTSSEESPWTM
jgi:hypothetical protein